MRAAPGPGLAKVFDDFTEKTVQFAPVKSASLRAYQLREAMLRYHQVEKVKEEDGERNVSHILGSPSFQEPNGVYAVDILQVQPVMR